MSRRWASRCLAEAPRSDRAPRWCCASKFATVAVALAGWLGGFAPAGSCVAAGALSGPMFELSLNGQRIEGTPLAWDEQLIRLLARDGALYEFAPSEARDYRKSAGGFRPLGVSEFRATLLREMGKGFDVTGTSHYLIVHRQGQRDRWAQRFEELYRAFVSYLSVRGLNLAEPAFPLVGIVCTDRNEFARYSAQHGAAVPPGVLGYYSPQNNRIVLYDEGKSDADWRRTASTIIHEATHQTAFNTGAHSRFAPPPLWLAEGLAMLFEAPGVCDSRNNATQAARINRGRLGQFRQLLPEHRPELLAAIVADDQLFQRSPGAAYAEAWAMTFFLTETQGARYARYLHKTAQRPPFSRYGAGERTADFQEAFGSDWRMFEAQFLRFMKGLAADVALVQ